jgi:hypothetical protein
MKKNMGILDRTIRLSIALVIGVLYYFEIVSGTFGVFLLLLAALFTLTGIFAFCPLYTAFGLYTCSVKKWEEDQGRA